MKRLLEATVETAGNTPAAAPVTEPTPTPAPQPAATVPPAPQVPTVAIPPIIAPVAAGTHATATPATTTHAVVVATGLETKLDELIAAVKKTFTTDVTKVETAVAPVESYFKLHHFPAGIFVGATGVLLIEAGLFILHLL